MKEKMNKKKLIIIVAAVLVVALLVGVGLMLKKKKAAKEVDLTPKPLDPPTSYQVENSSVPALVPREILVTQPLTEEQQAALEAQQAEAEEEEDQEEKAEKKSFKERLKEFKETRAEKKAEKSQKKAEKKAVKEAKKAAKEARKDAEKLEKQVEKLGENVDASIQEQLKEAQDLAAAKQAAYEALIPEPEEEPEEEKTEGEAEESEAIPTVTVSYRYDYLPDLQGTVVDYINSLTSEENGFQIVDETYLPLRRMPNFDVPAGMLRLAKNSGTEGVVIQVDLSWQDSTCLVEVTSCPGVVRELKPVQLLSSTEAVDYVKRINPKLLGLPGESMDDYTVYALDGAVLINNYPSIRLNIYSKVSGGSANEIAGQYYLSADGEHLYRMNPENGEVVELPRREIPRTDILKEDQEKDGETSDKKAG